MAVLPDDERKQIWSAFMSKLGDRQEANGFTMTKQQLRDAVNDIDEWINDNQASFNSALPEPAKSQLTAKHKVELFMWVAKRRWEIL